MRTVDWPWQRNPRHLPADPGATLRRDLASAHGCCRCRALHIPPAGPHRSPRHWLCWLPEPNVAHKVNDTDLQRVLRCRGQVLRHRGSGGHCPPELGWQWLGSCPPSARTEDGYPHCPHHSTSTAPSGCLIITRWGRTPWFHCSPHHRDAVGQS